MFNNYFDGWEVKPEFNKEFVSLWSGWLGKDNLHKLDEVIENEWGRFNDMIRSLVEDYEIQLVDCESQSLFQIRNIETILCGYTASMNKNSSSFTKMVIPRLDCVLTEEWDFTYIVWYKDRSSLEALIPYINSSGLKHFSQTGT